MRALPFPIYSLVPQRSLEEHDSPGLTEMSGTHGPMQTSVAITYTLWRNPELGLPDEPPSAPPHEEPWQARLSAVNPHARVEIDGSTLDAIEIDTDPFVYGIGAQLSPETVVTVVIPRVELPHVRIALARR